PPVARRAVPVPHARGMTMDVSVEGLLPAVGHPHRALRREREEADMDLQRDVLARTERAADAGEHEPHLLLGEPETWRDLTQILVEPLRRDVKRHAAVLPRYRESGLGPER